MKKAVASPVLNANRSSATKLKGPLTTARNPPNSPIPTAGVVFSDGRMLQLVRRPNSPQPEILVWSNNQAEITSAAHIDGKTYIAAEIEPSILASMLLPSGRQNYGSTRKLFTAISDVLRDYAGLEDGYARLATYFVFAANFADCLAMAPCLLLTGSAEPEAARLLRILRVLCRHSILLAGVSSNTLTFLPPGLQPTLLLYDAGHDASTEKFLGASRMRGFGILKNGGLRDLFCAKAVYLRRRSAPSAWADGSIQISVTPARPPVPVLDDKTELLLASEFQAKLLAFRLENYQKIRSSHFEVNDFAGPAREIARILGACIVDDEELRLKLSDLLRPQDEMMRVERATHPESIVVEALWITCHEPDSARTYVGEITELANGILKGRGETMQLSAREVGGLLRSLGVVSKRDAKGYAFILSHETRRKVHECAFALDVPSVREEAADCQFCAQIRTVPDRSGAACTS